MTYLHYVVHAARGRIWRDDTEAAALWRAIVLAFPDPLALCLMPTHLHLVLPSTDHAQVLPRALSGYARFRNHRRGDTGPVFAATALPTSIADERHLRRTVRYLALNPCRDRLVSCPLGWKWSTHRDRCGLSWPRIGRLQGKPADWHAYVSADPDTAVTGTPFPSRADRYVEWEEIESAVASVLRRPWADVSSRGPARDAFVGCALALGREPAEVSSRAELTPRRMRQITAAPPGPIAAICARVAGDPRFGGLAG